MASFICNHDKCKKNKAKIYKRVEDLNQHLRKSHLLVECNQCNDSKFFTHKNLKKHTEKIHCGSVICHFCLQPFGKQRRLLRRHYKYCSKARKQELYDGQKSRQDLDTCFTEFFKKKAQQHFSKANKDKKVRLKSIPKRKIPVPVPIKFRHRSINCKPNIIKFFE